MPFASDVDVRRMRDQLFFEGDDISARLSRFWLLLVLAAVIASAGVVGDSTATVIGAMIVAPLMVPILGTVVAVVLADRTNVIRCLALVVAGTASAAATTIANPTARAPMPRPPPIDVSQPGRWSRTDLKRR